MPLSTTNSINATTQPQKNPSNDFYKILSIAVPILSHALCLWIYYVPLVKLHPYHEAVLDESHILNSSNKDVTGENSLWQMFVNDYWGRPMTNWDSHKSWRPLSILSFRIFYHSTSSSSPILVARMVSVVLHAALAEIVSIVAMLLFLPDAPTTLQSLTLRTVTKLLFALHPAHVEAVANAANRPHILAVIFTLLTLDPSCHILMCAIYMALAFMSCETAIFQVPAVLITMTAIQWKRKSRTTNTTSFFAQLIPRYFVIALVTAIYLMGRIFFGTTDIPEGLIRPAENPFYALKGFHRIRNYSMVLSYHIWKSFYIDILGFSHEYGFNCVPQVVSFQDSRLILPFSLIVGVAITTVRVLRRNSIHALLDMLVAYAWLATLFPIAGFLKVGTFIADRIVVASTIVVAVFGGNFLTFWILSPKRLLFVRAATVVCLFIFLAKRCMHRSEQWMTSYELLKSSLITCPESAKSNLELSKCYSGLFPEKLNYDLATSYIKKAEEIDPNYCDVHWQLAQIHYKRQEYIPFEERLTKAVLCPFTMGGAAPAYNQYWQAVTQDSQSNPAVYNEFLQRKLKYDQIIHNAIEREKAKDLPTNKNIIRDDLSTSSEL